MQLTDDQRERIAEISRRHGAHAVRLFGSRARGEASESSDVDLLVEMDEGRSLLDLIDLQRALEGELGIAVDVLTPKSLSPYLRKSVESEAVEL
jgi:predicted nucleotidyltransferase